MPANPDQSFLRVPADHPAAQRARLASGLPPWSVLQVLADAREPISVSLLGQCGYEGERLRQFLYGLETAGFARQRQREGNAPLWELTRSGKHAARSFQDHLDWFMGQRAPDAPAAAEVTPVAAALVRIGVALCHPVAGDVLHVLLRPDVIDAGVAIGELAARAPEGERDRWTNAMSVLSDAGLLEGDEREGQTLPQRPIGALVDVLHAHRGLDAIQTVQEQWRHLRSGARARIFATLMRRPRGQTGVIESQVDLCRTAGVHPSRGIEVKQLADAGLVTQGNGPYALTPAGWDLAFAATRLIEQSAAPYRHVVGQRLARVLASAPKQAIIEAVAANPGATVSDLHAILIPMADTTPSEAVVEGYTREWLQLRLNVLADNGVVMAQSVAAGRPGTPPAAYSLPETMRALIDVLGGRGRPPAATAGLTL